VLTLLPTYLSSLHSELIGDPKAEFQEGTFPQDWANFLAGFQDGNEGKIDGGEAWVLAQLSWGDHLPSMSFSVAWLCFNGLRLQDGLYPIWPPCEQFERLESSLDAAGPPTWDAEELRALIGEYERNQLPAA
jgi:hypothetical protein